MNQHQLSSSSSQQENDFHRMIQTVWQRRQAVQAMTVGAVSFFLNPSAWAETKTMASTRSLLGFEAVAANSLDTLTLPPGYRWDVLIAWGDGVLPGAMPFDAQTRGDAQSQSLAMGDNNDGMAFFSLTPDHAVIAVNNEYTNYEYLFPSGRCASLDDTRKAQAAHGITVFEMRRHQGKWKVQAGAPRNRRITANTPMRLSGPAAGHPWLCTTADPSGTRVLGTFANCANGQTPWGTYLTCEENFNGYFGSQRPFIPSGAQRRYGLAAKDAGYQWHPFDERFDLVSHPNEVHRFGWIVEIDPLDPNSMPIKRTALGRFKHENASVVVNRDGRVVVYMGDDERGEHLYKFVSRGRYDPRRPTANRHLLDEGVLYVARFDDPNDRLLGRGRWLELTHGKNGLTAEAGFASQAEVLIHARLAATVVGATTMDRPEWVAAHPHRAEVYATLTNNTDRGVKANQPLNGPNSRSQNIYGQIVRWRPHDGDHAHLEFEWDMFVMAGNPSMHQGAMAGSANITPDNMFNSPDGLAFDAAGRLWIQTDGDYSNAKEFTGMGNNQMLCADPATGEIRRFLVGPVACEITGVAFAPDQRTLFVGIQHPGEARKPSHFPDGGDAIPRSCIVAIRRDDGGTIGT